MTAAARAVPYPRSLAPRQSNLAPRLALVLAMGLALWLGLLPLFTLPDVVPAGAPATDFSAERALAHLRVIAREPHPLGSPANAAVREYLVRELTALGLQPEVQTTTAVNRFPGTPTFAVGTVHNVVVRLPGSDSTGAIALDAHYDGATSGPAASDCGSCVASLLETVRALRAGPALKNDVILVFSDGEENRDLGAAAFVDEHPLAEDVRLAFNFEAMAAGGPTALYFTSRDNAWLVGEFAKAAPLPLANSFTSTLMNLLPGQQLGCDLEEYQYAGAAGLGFVYYTDDIPAYHTARDNVAEIDPRSVQHQGSYALSLVRHFGNLDLSTPPPAGDAVFFNLLPGLIVHYPHGWVLPLALSLGLLLCLVLALGFRRRRLTVGGLVVGTLAFPVAVVVALAAVSLTWAGLKAASPNLQVFLIGNYGVYAYLFGLAALLVATMGGLYAWLCGRARPANLAGGALLAWTVLQGAVSLSAPGMSFVFAWPLLCGLLAFGWTLAPKEGTGVGTPSSKRQYALAAVLALAALPGMAIVAQTTFSIVPLFIRLDALLGAAAGVPVLQVGLVLPALLLGLLVPHLAFLAGISPGSGTGRRWLVPGMALLVGLLLAGLGTVQSAFAAQHPRPTSVAYQLDADTGEAAWISVDRERNAWNSQFFPEGVERRRAEFPLLGLPALSAPAPRLPLALPQVEVLGDAEDDGVRRLRLRLLSARQAEGMLVVAEARGEIEAASIAGKRLDMAKFDGEQRRQLIFEYVGFPAQGAELALDVRGAGPIKVTLLDRSSGLPELPGTTIKPRPTDAMPAPDMPDPTVVRKSFELNSLILDLLPAGLLHARHLAVYQAASPAPDYLD